MTVYLLFLFGGFNMKTVYIIVQEGLVQTVYVNEPTEIKVVICDLDSTDDDVIAANEALEKQLMSDAYQIY
jgi:hypothetical protein